MPYRRRYGTKTEEGTALEERQKFRSNGRVTGRLFLLMPEAWPTQEPYKPWEDADFAEGVAERWRANLATRLG